MADVRKRGKKWQARIDYYDDDGKRHFKSKSGFKTKSEAQLFISQMIVDKNSSKFVPDTPPLFYEYFWNWFETYKQNVITNRTKNKYVSTYNSLKEYIPQIHVDEMNRHVYQKLLNEYGKYRSRETVKKFNAHVHACVKSAVYDEVIKKDFVEKATLVFDKSKTRKIEYLSEKEIQQLHDLILNTRNIRYTSKYMILLAIYTGMRLGEIQGLRWSDINFNFKTISIVRTWNSEEDKFQPTKNDESERIIRVNSEILDILKELKDNGNKSVFINQFGTIPTSRAVNNVLTKSLKELGIDRQGFHFHSLRHTHVAYLLSHKVDLYIISKRLGHNDISTTTKTYSYLIDEYKNRSNDEIENILNNFSTPKQKDTKIN